ncbi:sugar kinase [Holotrichia oblita]|nr:sugar kinase [Holotrichia oblita]
MEKKYIIAIDEGTTSARVIIFDKSQNKIINNTRLKFNQLFPKDGWVEHDPEEIWQTVKNAMDQSFAETKIKAEEVFGIGITNQRETVIAWDKVSGKPVYNAIVWQCRRTADYCKTLPHNLRRQIRTRTGLIVDAYFSATKMRWILQNVKAARELAKKDRLCFGTIDTWLVYKLTNGKCFYTDTTNASRTMLFNLSKLEWDDYLLDYFKIPKNSLPKILNSADDFGMAQTSIGEIKIAGVIGDQQSSLFGQGCFKRGQAKNTYGTGCFLLFNIGDKPNLTKQNLLSTVAWTINGKTAYALEGSVFNAGSALEWLHYNMNMIQNSFESSSMSSSLKSSEGVYVVPAFTGLGAPYWDSFARGLIIGITRGTKPEHVVRATLESIAYNCYDIVLQMQKNNIKLTELRCDGGVSNNNFLMQLQADLMGVKLICQENSDVTALGAVYMAGLQTGAYKKLSEIESAIGFDKTYTPIIMSQNKKTALMKGWKEAIKRSQRWS